MAVTPDWEATVNIWAKNVVLWSLFQDKLDSDMFWTPHEEYRDMLSFSSVVLFCFLVLVHCCTVWNPFPPWTFRTFTWIGKCHQSLHCHRAEKKMGWKLNFGWTIPFKSGTNNPADGAHSSQTKCLPVMSRCVSSAFRPRTSFIQGRGGGSRPFYSCRQLFSHLRSVGFHLASAAAASLSLPSRLHLPDCTVTHCTPPGKKRKIN